jgi:hypothetical protein
MITNTQCMELILTRFPEFEATWSEHLKFWGDDKAEIGNDVAAFAGYAESLIARKDPLVRPIFDYVEECLLHGDESVKIAFKTSFLENLLNAEDRIDLQSFVCFLGEESKRFCKEWNEFTGVDVSGI